MLTIAAAEARLVVMKKREKERLEEEREEFQR
jgi:hypothetical protein